MSPDHLAEALREVRRRMADACVRSKRDPASVWLVAVSKTVPAARVRELFLCGQTVFGENRVQEAIPKIADTGAGPRWHLVGHLQRNKARHAVGAFDLIHSVDDINLAREISRRAEAASLVQPILVEVNVADEATKDGVACVDLPSLLDAIAELKSLDLQGLMCVPPVGERAESSRQWFAKLRHLRDTQASRRGKPLPELSMGMSDDFEIAIEEGATLVRIGRALFGER